MSVLASLFIGRARPLARAGHPDVPSGIVKLPQSGALRLTVHGLEGDEQGDRVFHGGPEKAVHHYAAEHYAFWRGQYPHSPVQMLPGVFGENFSTLGMTESTVCIGDVYAVGSALLQVSQGRQPCWKLNRLLQREDAASNMQRSGATGWYYRVLREGLVAAGDQLLLVERPNPAWPMQRLIQALFPESAVTPSLVAEWRQAAELKQLTVNWQNTFTRRVQQLQLEDWSRRLTE